MNTICFVSNREVVPAEARELWRDMPIIVIGRTVFHGKVMHPVIPGSFMNESGTHKFSMKWAAKNLTFEEVRPGLYRGMYESK